jgi:translocation and assembly module TamA
VFLAVVSAVLALVASGFGAGANAEPSDDCATGWARPVPVRGYDVRFEGVEDPRIEDLFEESSQLIALRDRPPATIGGLERRFRDDLVRFEEILRSEGFYDGGFTHCIRQDADTVTVIITVMPGTGYRLKGYEVSLVGGAGEGISETSIAETAGKNLGKRARSADIVATEKRVLRALGRHARPLATVVDRKVTVDHRTATVAVVLRIDPGPAAVFGPVTIEGLESIEEDYVRNLVPWSQNDPFDAGKLETLRARLLATELFSTVVTEHADEVDDRGELPVTVIVFEAPKRSIGVGAKYSTGDGFAGEVFWEHRNLGGRNEDLKLSLEVGRITQQALARYRWPDFRRPSEDLVSSMTLRHIDSKAFDELGAEAAIGVRLPIIRKWRGAADVSLETARLKDQGDTDTSTLVGLPLAMSYDGTDSRTRPTEGVRFRLGATPYAGHLDKAIAFLASTVRGSGFLALDDERRFVLAGRAKAGSIVGESVEGLPANKRFYAGGDRSIRGYKFQRVGPLDDKNDPTGGRSLFEVGAELRVVTWRSIELVPFVEGGNVYDQVYPDFSRAPRWAAGLGLRHHTLIGPVRLDFAVPLNRRKDVDNPFQFYISLGQAF